MSDVNLRIVLVTIHYAPCPEAVPLAAACIASALKADAKARAMELDIVLLEAFASDDARKIADRIAATKANLVGFSLYLWNRDLSVAVARRVRALLQDALLFAGGADATARPGALSEVDGGPFDFIVMGEGEAATVRAIQTLAVGGELGTSLRAATDITSLPSPWLDGTLDARSRSGVLWELARGCPYACTYCYESKGERKVRYFSDERILGELEAFGKAKPDSVFVLDPTFNADKERARLMLSRIAELAPDTHWHFEIRAESLDRDLAQRFSKLGASLQIGLQSAKPEIVRKVARKLDKQDFTTKIGLLNDAGAVFGLDLIYGLPGDDLAGFRYSLDYALSLYPNNLDMFRLAVLPGTVLADQAAEFGLDYDGEAPYLVRSTPSFSAADLANAERLSAAANIFYNRGRAVPWFNQVLHPLGSKGAEFLEGFAAFLDRQPRPLYDPKDPVGIERLQLAYLDLRYEEAELDFVLPIVWDVVRFHGAWARALAEGIATDMDCSYDPDEALSPHAMDLEDFASLARMRPCHLRVESGKHEPRVSVS
ncbi:B12-binding domain-containing radical SAM protein [Treponema sp.]